MGFPGEERNSCRLAHARRMVEHASVAKTDLLCGALEIFQVPAFLCIGGLFNQEVQIAGF